MVRRWPLKTSADVFGANADAYQRRQTGDDSDRNVGVIPAAVAHAFYGTENVRVVILHPRGGIGPLQEGISIALGGNIEGMASTAISTLAHGAGETGVDDEGN